MKTTITAQLSNSQKLDLALANHFIQLAHQMERSGDRKMAIHFIEVAHDILDELEPHLSNRSSVNARSRRVVSRDATGTHVLQQ